MGTAPVFVSAAEALDMVHAGVGDFRGDGEAASDAHRRRGDVEIAVSEFGVREAVAEGVFGREAHIDIFRSVLVFGLGAGLRRRTPRHGDAAEARPRLRFGG